LDGTPADCVKYGLHLLAPVRPDLVVSGINPGPNLGLDVHYSATVAAAKEAAFARVPALSVSVERPGVAGLRLAARWAVRLALEVARRGLPVGSFLNVNVPVPDESGLKGAVVTRLSWDNYREGFEERRDLRDRAYYWLGRANPDEGTEELTVDRGALRRGYVSITPLHHDLTATSMLRLLTSWDIIRDPGLP
jgi:5'-nucleotidase